MFKNSIIFLAIFLSACATTSGVQVQTQTVKVPIQTPCTVETPDTPQYEFDKLTPESDLYSKVQALLADRLTHLGYEDKLRSALNTCTK